MTKEPESPRFAKGLYISMQTTCSISHLTKVEMQFLFPEIFDQLGKNYFFVLLYSLIPPSKLFLFHAFDAS
jgi:hypothetical protein